MIEKKIVRFVYPILEKFFPKRWADKLKMCGLILTGDWMFFPFSPLPIDGLSQEIVKKRFHSLDRFSSVCKKRIGLIKADVEGFGLKLLQGAKETIMRDRPVFSLAIYHNADEFFGIYEFLHELLQDYMFEVYALGHDPMREITLLAWPMEKGWVK